MVKNNKINKIILILVAIFAFPALAEEGYGQYFFTVTTTKKIPLSPEQNTTTTETSKKIIFLNKVYEEYDEGMDVSYIGVADGEYNLKSDQGANLSFSVDNGNVQKLKIISPLPNKSKSMTEECIKSSFLYKFMHAYGDKKTKIKYYMNSNNGSKYTESLAIFRFPGEDKIRVISFFAEGIDEHLYNVKSSLKLDTSTKKKQDDGILIPLEKKDPQNQKYLEIDNCVATYYKDASYFDR